MKGFASLVLCVSVVLRYVCGEVAPNQDSYLNALQTTHQATGDIEREDFDYAYHHDFNQGYDYQPIKPQYGPPAYGPPKPVYGPPPPIYGHPHPPPPEFYYHPRETWFLDKFKFKIDLFTIGKILLKLIIFKKIVKFIALICLLLFLPKLKNLIKEDDDEMNSNESRQFVTDRSKLNERLNEVTNFALTAFDTFSRKYEGCERVQIWCRIQRMVDVVDAKYPYEKIVKLYLPDNEVASNPLATNN